MREKTPNHEGGAMRCPVQLSDVDLFGAGAQEHWFEAYPILHAEAPVRILPGEGIFPGTDAFILTRYEDIALVVRDSERFMPTLSLAIDALEKQDGRPAPSAMIQSMASLRPNPELWRAHRQELTDPWVGPGAVRQTEMITQAADALIDDWIGDDEVELVSAFARPLPQIVMANVLGFPLADLSRLESWGNALVAAFVYGRSHLNLLSRDQLAAQAEAMAAFDRYVTEHVTARRAAPADDMISFLTQVTYQALGRTLTDREIVGIVHAMVLGGLETTQYAIVEQAQLLCAHDDLFDVLKRDRSKLRAFIEECLRLRAPTQGLSTRITTRDEVFQDVAVPKGSVLHLRFGAGNLDPEHYACPEELQLDRKRVAGHLSFSQGPRTCPGAGISRLEQMIAWDRLLDRLDAIALADGNRFEHQPGIMLGTLALTLRITPGAAARRTGPGSRAR